MKILLIADGRSPITRRWISMLQPLGFDLVLISSYPCEPVGGVSRLYTLPLAFARGGGSQAGGISTTKRTNNLAARFRPLAQKVRHTLGPWTIPLYARKYNAILNVEKPDLVHALRIPFEGMLAVHTPAKIPVIVSTWGNDLTLHAPSTAKMTSMTKQALQRANGLISDVQRDVNLAHGWGFDVQKPALVVPGNGGLDLIEMNSVTHGIQRTDPVQIINPRGMRTYVCNDTFFSAIPLVLEKHHEVQFVCPSMAGQSEALEWVNKLGIEKNITLLPMLSQHELWREFAKSRITLSISKHDGTPNSLLEAMALGCLPICGAIESIREWITPGKNGLLVNPENPFLLADQIIRALEDPGFQTNAAQINTHLIKERAALEPSRNKMKAFYGQYS